MSKAYQPDSGSIEARLSVIEEVLERIEHALFGNGQPGALSVINSRLTALEESKWKLAGALSAIVILFEVLKFVKGK